MVGWKGFGTDLKECTMLAFSWGHSRNPQNGSFRISGILAEILIQHFLKPNPQD